MANIENDFPKHSRKDWLSAILKTLKLDSESEIHRHIEFGSLDYIDYKLDPKRNISGLQLNTFPEKTELIRELSHGEKISEKSDDGLKYFLSSDHIKAGPEQKAIQIVQNKKAKHFGDIVLIDVLNIFESFNFDKKKILAYFETELKKENTHFLIDTTSIHNAGLNMCSEIAIALHFALMIFDCASTNKKKIYFMTATDSMFFASIAKLRAFRYLFETILENSKIDATNTFVLIAKPSLRETSAYEPWVNALRSTVSSASHLIAGADFSIAGEYDSVLSTISAKGSSTLSKRQSRNIFHILNLESSLGFIKDPSRGSFLIEDLSTQIITNTFNELKVFQKENDEKLLLESLSSMAQIESLIRFEQVSKRGRVICGANDFADIETKLSKIYQMNSFDIKEDTLFPLRRSVSDIEALRFKVEQDKKLCKKKILIITFGERKKLSARVNFVQNYFEVLGVGTDIVEFSKKLAFDDKKYLALTYCALDSDYDALFTQGEIKTKVSSFIAGKYQGRENLTNIYGGQNILNVLTNLVEGAVS